ncbi:hypothetical protein BU24DRAFT_490869 [Aaosphaeria arxii CBS 175.79]|uniref:Uncharacterized protein n=1 Tax=Aaosphaeria arxii CBS 175.79 TaxID=1450172 RepID=A0A6A5XZQ3_9PLEO|nr:uncharacterized protein BU24DRAFT_490869 [Aaosphaeria arxii CBS 175.79]KAF2017764.1 hypothetical protein BU24DRAFT_490869 [Aaosphaeria arxii CBS 175.79]
MDWNGVHCYTGLSFEWPLSMFKSGTTFNDSVTFNRDELLHIRPSLDYIKPSRVGFKFAREVMMVFYNHVELWSVPIHLVKPFLFTDPAGLGLIPLQRMQRLNIIVDANDSPQIDTNSVTKALSPLGTYYVIGKLAAILEYPQRRASQFNIFLGYGCQSRSTEHLLEAFRPLYKRSQDRGVHIDIWGCFKEGCVFSLTDFYDIDFSERPPGGGSMSGIHGWRHRMGLRGKAYRQYMEDVQHYGKQWLWSPERMQDAETLRSECAAPMIS